MELENIIIVTRIECDLPVEVRCFKDNAAGDEVAEKAYLDMCREVVSNFDEYTADDIAAILDNGFCAYGKGTISINHY